MTNKVAVAIDFGNFKLRIGVRYKDKVEIIKNEENYSSFSQMIIATEIIIIEITTIQVYIKTRFLI